MVPIDADEFWDPGPGGFGAVLADCVEAALEVRLMTFIQNRHVHRLSSGNLSTMTVRPDPSRVVSEGAQAAVWSREVAYVETEYLTKWISRTGPNLVIDQGNHGIGGIDGVAVAIPTITCLHAPLRARDVLNVKVEQGRRILELGYGLEAGWHLQRWPGLEDDGTLQDD